MGESRGNQGENKNKNTGLAEIKLVYWQKFEEMKETIKDLIFRRFARSEITHVQIGRKGPNTGLTSPIDH